MPCGSCTKWSARVPTNRRRIRHLDAVHFTIRQILRVQVILYGGVITTFNWQRALWLLREMPAREACS